MLQWINDRMKVIGWIFILPLALVFAVWGVEGIVDFTNQQGRALSVNGEDVDAERLRQAFQQQMAEVHQSYPDEVPAAVQEQVRRTIVDQFVNSALLDQKVTERGFVVTDKEVVDSVQQVAAFQVGGQFNRDSYYALLRAQGLSPAQFEAQQRQALRARQLEGGLFLSSFATQPELERVAAQRGDALELAWAVIPAARFLATAKADDAALQAYYEAHKSEFMTPETVTLTYVALRFEDVAKDVPVDEPALRAYYDSVKDRYIEAEKRRARHVLIQSGTDDAAARRKAEEVYALATKPGADFPALARQYSQDTGSAAQGGDLGWAEKSFFVGPFADALFAMSPGQVGKPVQTQFGWHVIKLEEVQAGRQKSFGDVRADLEAEYRKAEAERVFGERQEKLDQLAFESGGSLEGVAKTLALPVLTIPNFSKRSGGGEFTSAPKVTEAAFSPEVLGGQNSRALELAPGEVVVVRASDHKLPRQQSLAEVRPEVAERVRRELATNAARAAAESVAKQVRAGQPWDAALQQVGSFAATDQPLPPDALRAQPAKFVARGEPGVAPEVLGAAFKAAQPTADKPAVGTVPLVQGDHAVYVVTAVKPGAPGPDAAATRRELASRKAESDLLGYLAVMRERADIQYNPAVFE